MDTLQIALGLLLGAVFLFGPLVALVDIAAVDRRRFHAVSKDKTAWMLVVFFGWWVGAIHLLG